MLYGQESFCFARKCAPWNLAAPLLIRVAVAPFWLLSLPWFALACPILGMILDRFDKRRDFTVGYFVVAVKRTQP